MTNKKIFPSLEEFNSTSDIEKLYPSTEGIFDFISIGKFFSDFTAKFSNITSSSQLIPYIWPLSDLQKAMGIIKKYPKTELVHFNAVVPEYVDGKLVEYTAELSSVVIELLRIDKELLKPLEKWAANMLTDSKFPEKAWLMIPLPTPRCDEYTERLHKYFNESIGDGTANRLFVKAYKDEIGLQTVDSVLKDLTDSANKALNGELNKRADSVAKLILQVSNNKEKSTALSQLPPEKVKVVSDLILQTARELELLAVVLFQIKTASYAHKETLKKIIKDLL